MEWSIPISLLLEDAIQQQDDELYITWDQSSNPLQINSCLSIDNEQVQSSPALADDVNNANNNQWKPSIGGVQSTKDPKVKDKRKRQDVRNQCEAKRRSKFNEQLDILRCVLNVDQQKDGTKKRSKVTRENLMTFAIEEILKLRQELSQVNQFLSEPDTPFQKLRTGIFPMWYDPVEVSLSDPHNRAPYSTEDLERSFQTLFAREVVQFCTISSKRIEQNVFHSMKMLEDLSKQLGKPEYQLSVGVLEQMYHSALKFNPKELTRVLEHNWSAYQDIKVRNFIEISDLQKTKAENLMLVLDSEIGAWILFEMSWIEYMTGNIEASERTYGYAKELTKRFKHRGTNHFMLATNLLINFRGTVSVSTAERICVILQTDFPWGPLGCAILGIALIAAGKHKEGLETVELSVSQMLSRKGDSVHLFIGCSLLSGYIQTRSVGRGLCVANYMLRKYNEYNIEGFLGKSEMLRQKANLLILKKYPDFIPEPIATTLVDESVQEIVNLCELEPTLFDGKQVQMYGPLEPSIIQPQEFDASAITNDEIEMLLRSSMSLAHTRGLVTIELRCAIDLARFFLHCGDFRQAVESIQEVKECVSKMKGPDTMELQRARHVIALVEESQ